MRNHLLTMAVILSLGAGLRAEVAADKPVTPPPPPAAQQRIQDPALRIIREEMTATQTARNAKLAELSPAFTAARTDLQSAKDALKKDAQNPEAKQAVQAAQKKLDTVTREEIKKLREANPELKALDDAHKQAAAKFSAFMKQKKEEAQKAKANVAPPAP